MTKIAIIDLDGVIADPSKRFEAAENRRIFYRQHLHAALPDVLAYPVNQAFVQKGVEDLLENIYWQVAFSPELVALDRPLRMTQERLFDLEEAGWKMLYLTSRPEPMREATLSWLIHWTLFTEDDILIMKPPHEQFKKTAVWKVEEVQRQALIEQATDVLFIDDEEVNRQAMMDAWLDRTDCDLIVAASLKDALAKLAEDASS